MAKYWIIVLAAFLVAVQSDSLCGLLSSGNSEAAFMQQFVTWSFESFKSDELIAPFFDGMALDREGQNVTNYFGNNTLYQKLINSHVQYFAK